MSRPFAEIVRVRNVSNRGAVLAGVRAKVRIGEVLDMQLGPSRAQFRIVWMSASGDAGVQALEMEPPIFGLRGGIGLPRIFAITGNG